MSGITKYRSESLRLYRDILRATRMFTWRNAQGQIWGDILRENARKEFELAKYERDPQIITRLLVVGRDCLQQTVDKLDLAAKKMRDNIDRTRTS